MKTKIIFLLAAMVCMMDKNLSAQNLFGEIAGTITDEQGNLMTGAIVSYVRNGNIQGTTSDDKGRYRLKPLDAGMYDLSFSFIGVRKDTVKRVSVSAGQITNLDYSLFIDNTLSAVEIIYHKGLFEKDQTMNVVKLNTEDIKRSPETGIIGLVSTTPAVYKGERDDKPNVRGSRSDATQYFVDGVKMIGSFFIPKSAIKEISVITGGLPAMFGDATGGVVVITTKSYWDRE